MDLKVREWMCVAVLSLLYGTTEGEDWTARYTYLPELGETGKFIVYSPQRLCYVCPPLQNGRQLPDHYYDRACVKDDLMKLKIEGSFAFCNSRYGKIPGCSMVVQSINNGFWDCNYGNSSLNMTVYKTCTARCHAGYQLEQGHFSIRCGENLKLNSTHLTAMCVKLSTGPDETSSIPSVSTFPDTSTTSKLSQNDQDPFTKSTASQKVPGIVQISTHQQMNKDSATTPREVSQSSKAKVQDASIGEWWHILLVVVGAVIVLIVLILVVYKCCWRKRKESPILESGHISLTQQPENSSGYSSSSTPESSSENNSNTEPGENDLLLTLNNNKKDIESTSPTGNLLQVELPVNENLTEMSDYGAKGLSASDCANCSDKVDTKTETRGVESHNCIDSSDGQENRSELCKHGVQNLKPCRRNGTTEIERASSVTINSSGSQSDIQDVKHAGDCAWNIQPMEPVSFPSLQTLSSEDKGPSSFFTPSFDERGEPVGESHLQTTPTGQQSDAAQSVNSGTSPSSLFLPSASELTTSSRNSKDGLKCNPDSSPHHNSQRTESGPTGVIQRSDSEPAEVIQTPENGPTGYGIVLYSQTGDIIDIDRQNIRRSSTSSATNLVENKESGVTADKCGAEECCKSLSDLREEPDSKYFIEKLDMMLFNANQESLDWKGLCHWMLHGKKPDKSLYLDVCGKQSILKDISPGNGAFSYLLNNDLIQHGFHLGHIVFYFSCEYHFRQDVIQHIQQYHQECSFCQQFYQNLK